MHLLTTMNTASVTADRASIALVVVNDDSPLAAIESSRTLWTEHTSNESPLYGGRMRTFNGCQEIRSFSR